MGANIGENDSAVKADLVEQAAPRRPTDLPPVYEEVLRNVEVNGWDSVEFKDGYTMLHWAASKGRFDICQYLITKNASLALCDKYGRTAFDCARENGHKDTAKLLEELGGKSHP